VKKFLLLYYGSQAPTADVRAAWQSWFAGVGDRVVDSGNPLGGCLEVTRTGRRELSPDTGAATGYSIISAQDRAEAERLLEGCPFATSVRICEAMPM
jgi:hypothetical protein